MRTAAKILALLAMLIMAPPGNGDASAASGGKPRVFAILSSGAKPYQDHLERFKLRFSGSVDEAVLPNNAADLEKKLRRDPPDLVLALGPAAARFAKGTDLPAPVLFAMVYDPAKHGLAAGESICGIELKVSPEKTLEALETVLPSGAARTRVGALVREGSDPSEAEALRKALEAGGYPISIEGLSTPEELPRALENLLARIDALWLLMDPGLISERQYLDLVLNESLDRKVAVIGLSDEHVRMGALLATSVDYYLEGDHSARLAREILEGADPRQIGVQPPENVIWSLNLRVAKEIGLNVPPLSRKRFEKVYQ